MHRVLCLAALAWASAISWANDARAEHPFALRLDDLIESLADHHPLILAERGAVDAANAELLAARGEFDTLVSVQARTVASGYYDPKRVEVVVEQPTPLLGSSLYAGYRVTRGNVAPYYGEQRTLEGGEVRAGARVPLWQDRALDARRAGRDAAQVLRKASERGYAKVVLDLEREAAFAYYAWIAAGQRLAVLDRLVSLAELRETQIGQKVALGALPAIEQLDNRRSVLERKRQRVAAERVLQKAAIDLSLFLRASDGSPRIPDMAELPEDFALQFSARPASKTEALSRALSNRPELSQQQAWIAAARIESELAANRTAPRVDAFGEVSKDLGPSESELDATLRPTVVEVGVTLSMPLWMRKARGKLDSARAKLRAAEQKAAFVRNKVQSDTLDAWSQLDTARERSALAEQTAEAAREVAQGERERFDLGATTILFVNLREQAAADAEMALIDAQIEAHYAQARLQLAMGQGLSN